jgi:nitroimidazol reductase NimA-like FMN-containing flavoprotein (pyridoxamine 5'-phosphate oxidase superfamily)
MSEQATITTLTDDECWEVLAAGSVGRLATAVGGDPEIFPISFGTAGRAVYFVTKAGTKLVELVVNNRVAFETDAWDDTTATSVVVKGVAAILETDADLAAAEEADVEPFAPDGQSIWVRITPTAVSGRRLRR